MVHVKENSPTHGAAGTEELSSDDSQRRKRPSGFGGRKTGQPGRRGNEEKEIQDRRRTPLELGGKGGHNERRLNGTLLLAAWCCVVAAHGPL